MTRILVVEDDVKIAKLLTSDLEIEGYKVDVANDGQLGYELAKTNKPDLIILDLMLPKMNGYDVCRALRNDKVDVPIIMLTAKGQESEKVVGLNLGADDYVTKPFSGLELMARIKAMLRRHKGELKKIESIQLGDIQINFKKMEAKNGTTEIQLTKKEFEILELLARHRGEVVTRRQFLDELWGYEEFPSTRTVDNQVLTLRKKLSSTNNQEKIIQTVHGVGYKLII